MANLAIVFCVILLGGWIVVSDRLWRIHIMGTQLYYNYVYKPDHLKSGIRDLMRSYKLYMAMLWTLEVVTGVGMLLLIFWVYSGHQAHQLASF